MPIYRVSLSDKFEPGNGLVAHGGRCWTPSLTVLQRAALVRFALGAEGRQPDPPMRPVHPAMKARLVSRGLLDKNALGVLALTNLGLICLREAGEVEAVAAAELQIDRALMKSLSQVV